MKRLAVVISGLLLVSILFLIAACNTDENDEDLSYPATTAPNYVSGTGISLSASGYTGVKGAQGPAGPAGISGGESSQRYSTVTLAPAWDESTVPTTNSTIDSQLFGTDRMIVRTGNINLKVKKVSESLDSINVITQSLGGYVVSSNHYGGENSGSASISIRVPADKYDTAVNLLRDLAVEVLQENTTASDVTEEYTDLESQLRNLEATEEQYLVLLGKATDVQDMLSVESNLSDTRSRIEQTKGRMLYLERTSSTSLIYISLIQDTPLKAEFAASKIVVREGEKVYFLNQTAGGSEPFGYSWDFGDGNSSSEMNPAIKYDHHGKYTISLTMTDAKGNTSTQTKSDYITVEAESGWSGGDTAESAWDGLAAVGRGLGSFFIWVGILAVIWVPVVIVIYLAVRRLRKSVP
ncbi:MAG: DUF4349 domain-containing protein [Dehalococcoidia bacterium]|nr:DUF4349 domain-containing protein [Dehalococcoidia bacterium]